MIQEIIGRADDLERLRQATEEGGRLITLVGPGGVGKTTLARTLLGEWDGPRILVQLEGATSDEDVLRCLAAPLGFAASNPHPQRLVEVLQGEGEALLVLDNVERVTGELKELLASWLPQIPDVRVLATSRQSVGIDLETTYDVRPLSLEASVELFIARAGAADPSFDIVMDSSDDEITALLTFLDRIPLAIELAAARVRVASVADILTRLERQSELLRQGDDRHSSLDACIAWSVELLDERERTGLAQCAVFTGQFELEDAEAVVRCGVWAGDLLDGLLERSLITTRRHGGRLRFVMFDTVRRYCRSHLGVEDDTVVRWGDWLIGEFDKRVAQRYEQLLPQASEAFDALLRIAPERAAHLVLTAERPFRRAGSLDRLHTMQNAMEEIEGISDADRVNLAVSRASLYLSMAREDEASRLIDEVEPVVKRLGLKEVHARIWQIRGWMSLAAGDTPRAAGDFDRAAELLPSNCEPGLAAHIYGGAAIAAMHRREFRESVDLADQAMTHAMRSPDLAQRGRAMGWKANGLAAAGDFAGAVVLLNEGLRQFQITNDFVSQANLGMTLAEMLWVSESPDFEATFLGAERAAQIWGYWLAEARAMSLRARWTQDLETARKAVRLLRHIDYLSPRGVLLNYVVMLAQGADYDRALSELDRGIEAVGESDPLEADWLRRYKVAVRVMARDEAASTDEPNAELAELMKDAVSSGSLPPDLVDAYSDAYLRCEYGFHPEPATLIEASLSSAAQSRELTLANDAKEVTLPDGTTVDLSSRHTLRRFLLFMVKCHEESPGRDLDLGELMDGGWPDEQMTYESGKQRVYAAIKHLRKVGLGPVVLTGESGYLLDPNVIIRRV